MSANSPRRVAIVADLLAERWPSMDLVADMLHEELQALSADWDFDVTMIRPDLWQQDARATVTPGFERTFDRFVNRFWNYPNWLRSRARSFDLFHIVDHSYAHLVHVLPAHRTIVTCHDVDAFLSLVEPGLTRSKLPNVVSRIVLSGMRRAALVTCDSVATYDDILRYNLVPRDRLIVVPNGTHAAFSPTPVARNDERVARLLDARTEGCVELLHVGTTIPRKRIDVLLRVVAAIREVRPEVRLLKAGGTFTVAQRDLIGSLGLESAIVELPFLERDELAALYRRAAAVLVTSDREGFGLPVAEAMACGTPVVATDLAVLREVGGPAGVYCALDDISGWRDAVLGVLDERREPVARMHRRDAGLAQAHRFSWASYAAAMAGLYDRAWHGARDARPDAPARVAV
jgi:glycosyltransferase involved in cell wall biosynthesis